MKKKQSGIFGSIRINKEKYIEEFLNLYNQGLNDTEISKILEVNNVTISTWRNERGLEKNFKYTHKFDENLFMKYYNEGLNYSQIAEKLGVSDSCIQSYASQLSLSSNYNKYEDTKFTKIEYQVFIGTMLGDSYLRIPEDSKNATGHFAHSLKQKNYCIWKYNILKRFCSTPREVSEYDQRTGKTYYAIDVNIKAHPLFTKLYPCFYHNKIKYIHKTIINSIEALGIAVWFMDDGFRDHDSYSIATNCFTKEDIDLIIEMFKNKFDIHFSMQASHIIRASTKDANKFKELVRPYIHPECLYKLGEDVPKTPLNGETPEMDNPVLIPQEIEENA